MKKSSRVFLVNLPLFLSLMIITVLFSTGYIIPIKITISLILLITAYFLYSFKSSRHALLPRLYFLLLSMPYWTLAGYLFFDDYDWWESPSALIATTPEALDIMGHLGIIAILSFGLGVKMGVIGKVSNTNYAPQSDISLRVLNIFSFLITCIFCLLCVKYSAPESTIFTTSYGDIGGGAAEAINLFSLSLVSQCIILLLCLDFSYDHLGVRRRIKFISLGVLLYFSLIHFGFFRGDRDTIGLICALIFLYISENQGSYASMLGKKRRLIIAAVVSTTVILSFTLLQNLRVQVADQDYKPIGEQLVEALKYNTWSAVLLNNLGTASVYSHGDFDFLYGKTYYEYFLSLPPGFITKIIGYERPLESTSGPNWWFAGLSAGGSHPVMVPFHNFGAFGVFVLLFAQGWLIGKIESKVGRSFFGNFWYGIFVLISFRWFWYGDMNFIRAMMIGGLLCLVYHLASPLRTPSGNEIYS